MVHIRTILKGAIPVTNFVEQHPIKQSDFRNKFSVLQSYKQVLITYQFPLLILGINYG